MITQNWIGQVCYIFAGGPSLLTQPYELLRGERTIVINSSWERAPWADILFFHDDRWWRKYGAAVLLGFRGKIYTTMSTRHPRVVRLRNTRPGHARVRQLPLRISDDPASVPMRSTSVVPTINIALLKGAAAIVVLGLDGHFGENGSRNHYGTQYPWKHMPGTWEKHIADVAPLVPEIAERGVLVLNASPGSSWPFWPVMTLQEAIIAANAHADDSILVASPPETLSEGKAAAV